MGTNGQRRPSPGTPATWMMRMGMRWFGAQNDPIPLEYIRQVPGVSHVVGALWDVPVGAVWPVERIAAMKAEIERAGLSIDVVESVNIHDDIKTAGPGRDHYIDTYIASIRNLARCGISVICYNFMAVFDWIRTDLHAPLPDGSFAMAYDRALVSGSVDDLMARMRNDADGFLLPGWEEERLADIRRLLAAYQGIDSAQLADNLRYFLQAILPTCEEVGMRMAIHPDDPPEPLFGLPRVLRDAEDMRRIESFYDSPNNGFTFCTGSLAENPDNDIPAMLREFIGRDKVPFVHARNIRRTGPGRFHESAHLSSAGSLDMYEVMRALHESGFDGWVRPDHGRDIWGERGRPGYGLYDRALGIAYLTGLGEALAKSA